jgi:hypothetical protein
MQLNLKMLGHSAIEAMQKGGSKLGKFKETVQKVRIPWLATGKRQNPERRVIWN